MTELEDQNPVAVDFTPDQEDGEFNELKVRLVAEIGSARVSLRRRMLAGHILGIIGDPRLGDPERRITEIPEETVTLGWSPRQRDQVAKTFSDLDLEAEWLEKSCPEHQKFIRAFRLSRHLVTNGEYSVFLREVGNADLPTAWPGGTYPVKLSNHPVSSVSISSAKAYCDWLSSRNGKKYRLPTEAEWEYAAAGRERRLFPWGNTFLLDRANTREQGILRSTPVGIFPAGVGPFGIHDMGGNVEEWTSTGYEAYPGGTLVKDWFYKADNSHHVTRGGSFNEHRDLATCQRRHGSQPHAAVGFRIAETA